MADFTQNDLSNWAQGQGDPAAGDAGSSYDATNAAGGVAEEGAEPGPSGDPAEVLRQAANEMEEASGIIASVTLPDGEDKKFSKRWDAIQESIDEMVTEARDMADTYEADHEDDEDEEEDDEADEDDDTAAGGDDEASDDEGGKSKAPAFGKKDE